MQEMDKDRTNGALCTPFKGDPIIEPIVPLKGILLQNQQYPLKGTLQKVCVQEMENDTKHVEKLPAAQKVPPASAIKKGALTITYPILRIPC